MDQRRLIGLGYAAIGVLLLFGEFLPDRDAIFTSSMPFIPSLAVVIGSIGCIGMIVVGVDSLLRPEGRLEVGQEADSRLHLYLIWVAVLLVAGGVVI